MSKRLLVTGFGPFGTITENPSGEVAKAVHSNSVVLPVTYADVDAFVAELNPESFDTLLMLGVNASAAKLKFELYARNYRGAVADVNGFADAGAISEDAPLLVPSTLWSDSALLADFLLRHPFEASLNAGTYLCNYISFRTLLAFPQKSVGFLHVPPVKAIALEEQVSLVSGLVKSLEG